MSFVVDPPAIIRRSLSESEIRQEEREKIARFLENATEIRLPEMLRGCGFGDSRDSDGWAELCLTEKHLMKSAAGIVRAGAYKPKTPKGSDG